MSLKYLNLNSITLIIFLVVALLLGGCGESKINAESKSIKKYPEGVQNGTVTTKYYDELMSFLELDTEHQTELSEMMDSFDKNPKLMYSNEKIADFGKSITSYNEFLINFNPVDTTQAEKEFSALIMDISESQLALNTSLEKFVKSKNVLHLFSLSFRSDSYVKKREELSELAKKYKIHEE